MVRLRVLGPMGATREGEWVGLGGPKQRSVLALLVVCEGHRLDVDVLIEMLWGDDAPDSARASLQAYVSRLRAALGDGALAWDGAGYALRLPRDAVDAWTFEDTVGRAAGIADEQPEEATRLLDEALGLWEARPFAGLDGIDRLDQEVRRLEELRLRGLELSARSRLATGRAADVVAELEELAEEHPTRERLRGLLMLALYRTGRQADALGVYEATRRLLVDELGVEPSPELRALHRRVLEQDPTLTAPPRETPAVVTDLPRGTVTFVATDIEGSTRLHHRLGPVYGELLARHLALLRQTWEAHGGAVYVVDGDRTRGVFPLAEQAVAAALEVQRAWGEEPWPDDLELRVRIGLHTGLGSPEGAVYRSLAAHEVESIVGAANGGQLLLSPSTVAALEDVRAVRRLGRYRLQGLDEPIELYAHADAPGDGRVVRARPAEQHNLVEPRTATVGRSAVIDAVAGDLRPGATVSLLGAGGVGKTRIATEVGLRLADAGDGGAWFVDLSAATGEAEVAAAIAETIGAGRRAGNGALDDVAEHIDGRREYLLLDNCEQAVAAVREVVQALVARCPRLAILATSRERLHVPGERVHAIEPLDVPGADTVTAVDGSAAGRLFLARAADALVGFELGEEDAAAVAGICRSLDGLPLPLELAAALVPVQSVHEIATSLRDRTGGLRRRERRAPGRHDSVDELVGWSTRLLDDQLADAFRRLGVLAGSFRLETAALAIGAGRQVPPDDVALRVWALVDRSLVGVDPGVNGTRYRMLGIVRDHARDRLDAAGETADVARSVAEGLLDRCGPEGPFDVTWTRGVGADLPTLQGLVPVVGRSDQRLAQRIATTIGLYRDHTHDFRRGAQEVAAMAERLPEPSPERVGLLANLADLRLREGEVVAARRALDEADAIAAEHGPAPWDAAAVARARGEAARRSGDLESAVALARAALEAGLEGRARARMLNLLGTSAGALGRLDESYAALREELEVNRAIDAADRVALSHANLAETALRLGDTRLAAHHQADALADAVTLGSPMLIAYSLIVAARLTPLPDGATQAVRLLAHADRLLDEIGLALYADDRRVLDEVRRAAEEALGEEGARIAATTGRASPTDDAIAIAERLLEAAAEPAASRT